MRGRKPLPTELHLLRGNPGKRRREKSAKAPASAGYCPRDLEGEVARTTWRRLAPVLRELGILTQLDELALALFCDAVQDYDLARRELQAERESRSRCPKRLRDASRTKRDARADAVRLLAEFGLTPSARVRVIPPASGGEDLLADFLNGGDAS